MKREAAEPIEELEKGARASGQEESPAKSTPAKEANGTQQSQPNTERLPPKARVALIVGYNGSGFAGSQKNDDVRTVEEEVEKALYAMKCISPYNFGDLKKVAWNRATRTDKSVHALQNVFSLKIHLDRKYRDGQMEEFRGLLNDQLAKQLGNSEEIRVFTVIEVSNRFNAKNTTSHREYSYYLPSFTLAPIHEFYLGKKGTNLTPEEQRGPRAEDVTGVRQVNGITITSRFANEDDKWDKGAETYLTRDITHLTSKPEFLAKLYAFRLSDEQKKKVHDTFVGAFQGTQKYHNFSRDMKPEQSASQRYMIDLSANDYMYVNQDTLEVTNAEDPRALEFVHYYLKGQSFLYNQIRKMVGSQIQGFHGEMDIGHFLSNTMTNNGVLVALAPGDGLMLERVAYDRYNEFNTEKKADIMVQRVGQTNELEAYRKQLVSHIAQRELKAKAFVAWMSWFDDSCADHYVTCPSIEVIEKQRGADFKNSNEFQKIMDAQKERDLKKQPGGGEQEQDPKVPEEAKVPETPAQTKPAEAGAEAPGMSLYIPLDQALVSKGSPSAPTMADVLAKSPKLIGIYYSMHDCPPCREFTPLLAALYEEVNEDSHQLEVIFFSGDKTDAQFDEYFGEMPWLALPRAQKSIMMQNAKRFKIKGVPRLVMLRASDGKILADQCVEDLTENGPAAMEKFLEEC